MGYQSMGNLPGLLRERQFIPFSQIKGGTVAAQELVIAGGTSGKVMSQNYVPGVSGWALLGDGTTELNGATPTLDGLTMATGVPIIFDGATPASFIYDEGDYSPGFSNVTAGTGFSQWGRYVKLGRLCFFETGFTLGTGGSVAGNVKIDLPIAPSSTLFTHQKIGDCMIHDTGTAIYPAYVAWDGSSKGDVFTLSDDAGLNGWYVGRGNTDASNPHTWAAGDQMLASGSYLIDA